MYRYRISFKFKLLYNKRRKNNLPYILGPLIYIVQFLMWFFTSRIDLYVRCFAIFKLGIGLLLKRYYFVLC
jgi:hypothetical protein